MSLIFPSQTKAAGPCGPFAVFSDFDGTLVPFLPVGSIPLVPVEPALQDLLRRLHHALGGAVAVVSGRQIESLTRLFPSQTVPVSLCGSHGAQWQLSPAFPVNQLTPSPELEMIYAALKERVGSVSGIFLEHKGFSVAAHDQSPPQHQDMLNSLRDMVTDYPALSVLEAQGALEFRMRGVTKGTGIEKLMSHSPFSGRTPIFLGDDMTDLDAFPVCRKMGGLCVSVGKRIKGRGDIDIEGPGEVRAWLDQLIRHPARIPAPAMAPPGA